MHPTLRLSRQFPHYESSLLSPALLNSNIKASVQQGQFTKALQLYSRSPLRATPFTFPSLVRASAFLSNLTYGKTLHSTIIQLGLQFDPFITTSLINMYVNVGHFLMQLMCLEKMIHAEEFVKDVTLWNSLLDGYFKFGQIKEGLAHFNKMRAFGVLPDAYSVSILLGVLGYKERKEIHGYIVRNMFKSDPFLESSLIDMYSRCCRIMAAWSVFDHLEDNSHVVFWNVIISGFFENGLSEWILKLYSLMKGKNVKLVSESFSCTISACAYGDIVDFGRQVHCDVTKLGFETNPFVYTSLLSMYGKCQFVEDAKKVSDLVFDKGTEIWNAMISTFVCNGYFYAAFEVYNKMRYNAINPGPKGFVISKDTPLTIVALINSKIIHGYLVRLQIQSDIHLENALIEMLIKCGFLKYAENIFQRMSKKDVVTWNCMISGHGSHGDCLQGLSFFP